MVSCGDGCPTAGRRHKPPACTRATGELTHVMCVQHNVNYTSGKLLTVFYEILLLCSSGDHRRRVLAQHCAGNTADSPSQAEVSPTAGKAAPWEILWLGFRLKKESPAGHVATETARSRAQYPGDLPGVHVAMKPQVSRGRSSHRVPRNHQVPRKQARFSPLTLPMTSKARMTTVTWQLWAVPTTVKARTLTGGTSLRLNLTGCFP